MLANAELCRETYAAEGYSAAEIEDEAALIRAQLAYVQQLRGDNERSLSTYRDVLKLK